MLTQRVTVAQFLVLAWCAFLAVQWGDPYDETEHAHAAWLIGELGQRPHHDFFQHHQPALWHVLSLYYLVGKTGPEVLYWGRALVVASAFVSYVGMWALARRTALNRGVADGEASLNGLLAVAPWIALSVAFPPLFVVRPETIGLAGYVLSVCCWMPGNSGAASRPVARIAWDFAAGLLFGSAVLFSPRYLPLLGGFLLLRRERGRLLYLRGNLLVLALGCATAVLSYVFFSGYSLAEMWFNVEFTSVMAKIGQGYFLRASRIAMAVAAGLLVCWLLARNLEGLARRRFVLGSLYLAVLAILGLATAWPYLYSQSLVAALAWASVLFATAEGELSQSRKLAGPLLGYVLAGCWATVAVIYLVDDLRAEQTIVSRVEQKRSVLASVLPDARVLMGAAAHPICVQDASFYGHPVVDPDERLPRAVASLRDRWQLPECDYYSDIIRKKPAIIDGVMLELLPERELREVIELLEREYVRDEPFPKGRDGVYRPLYVRLRGPTQASGRTSVQGVIRPALGH